MPGRAFGQQSRERGADRRRGGRWLALVVALIGLAGLVASALTRVGPQVEADLARRATARLAESGESWASVRFRGRDGTLEGEALAEEARAKVRASLADVFGVRVVRDATTLLPERRPFTFSAIKDSGTIAFDGYVPSRRAAARIVEAAKAKGLKVAGLDRLTRARGAPPGDFAGLVLFGLDQLAQLPSGRITLSDGSFAIEGRAGDLAIYDALARALDAPLPQGMKLAHFGVRPPVASPFFWQAVRDGDAVKLTGYVPSEAARAEVLAALRTAVPGARVTDDMRLADGAPATDMWLKAVRYAGQLLSALPQGRAALSDSTLTAEGMAPGFAAYDALAAARRAPPEGFQITRFVVEPPRVSPFFTTITRDGDSVRLSGHLPSEEARKLVTDAVRGAFPGVSLVDEARLASGGPKSDAWAGAVHFAVAQLARLRGGTAQLTGADVSLSGEAMDSAAYVTLMQAVRTAADGLVVEARQVRPPVISPYVFAVRRDGEGLTVSGFFPDEAAHAAILAALERDFLKEKVNDLSAIGAGAPAGFTEAVLAGLAQLARAQAGDLSLGDAQLRLSGTALRPEAVAEMEADLKKTLKPPFAAEMSLAPAEPGPPANAGECQALIADLMRRGSIGFVTGSARIEAASAAILDRLVYILQRCPEAAVAIEGHTDATGDAAANQRLSEGRAAAVVAYLVQAGIAATRLSAAGLGATRPVAGNDGEAGRAQNRRIEFLVKEGP